MSFKKPFILVLSKAVWHILQHTNNLMTGKPMFYLGPFYGSSVFHLHTYIRTKSKSEILEEEGALHLSRSLPLMFFNAFTTVSYHIKQRQE